MMEDNNEKQQGIQIDLQPEIAVGKYSNLALITHSSSDFILDFAEALPGMPKPQVVSRLIMAPEHAKRLLAALQENVFKYEQVYGKIEIPEQSSRTATPFGPVKEEN